jgi:hypothetical protein
MDTNIWQKHTASVFGIFIPFRVIRSSGMKQYVRYIVADISVEIAGTIFKAAQEEQPELKKK